MLPRAPHGRAFKKKSEVDSPTSLTDSHRAVMAASRDSALSFAATPLARRDLARHTATCMNAGSLTALVTAAVIQRGHDLNRVLLVDGRCLCKNNGIGNLFGDYVTWFTVAALSDRALFIDWTDSASGDSHRRSVNASHCLASGIGFSCFRVPRRFDLGAHFAAIGGRSWRWTARARTRVEARHGTARRVVCNAC